jgi:hypothetical protein
MLLFSRKMDSSRDSASNLPSRHGQDFTKDCHKCGLDKQVMANRSQEERWMKILGYTPLLSQLASVCCMTLGQHDVACDLQRLFIQGIVDFFKRLFYMAHVLWTCQYLTTVHQNQAHCCNHDFSAWMAPLQKERLWDLCLPGTHNSHAYACRPTPFGTDWVLCQRLSVRQQLEAGVRLLDFRLSNETHFGHGPVETSRLDVVANDIVSFASMHPTEVVVCLVKANGKHTKLQDANSSPSQIFQNALQDALTNQTVHGKCRCATSISLDMPQTEHAATRLKQQTLNELTNDGTRGKVLIDAWSHWEGSWHYTNSNLTHEVEQKSREWTRRKSGRKPRVLELIMTVDSGETRKTIELALLHSVESLNYSLFPHVQQGDMLSAPILCNIQAVLLDYPTEAQIHSIVAHNTL